MTVQNPALYLQGANHPAEDFRHLISSIAGDQPGVFGTADLAVSEKSGTANMSVDVAEGTILVAGDEATYQGLYLCHNRGVTNLTVSAADGSNPRWDLVVAQVEDSDYSGATDAWKLAIVTGTAAASPAFPTVPDNSFVLAVIEVAAGVSVINDADITDVRSGSATDSSPGPGTTTLTNYGLAPSPGVVVCNSAYRPQSPFEGMEIFESDTNRKWRYFNSLWVPETSYCQVQRSTNQLIPDTTGTDIDWDLAIVDTDDQWTAGADGFKVFLPWPGLYAVTAQMRWSINNSGYRAVSIQKNSATQFTERTTSIQSSQTYQVVHGVVRTTGTTEYVNVSLFQDSGSGVNAEGVGSFDPSLTVVYLGVA